MSRPSYNANGVKFWLPELSNINTDLIGEDTVIHSHVWIGNNVSIGRDCKIQAFAFIPDGVTIGDNVFIGPHVCFTNDKYPPSGEDGWAETKILEGCSIGAGAIILPGITIGPHVRVGAGAVVTKSFTHPGSTIKGNPAKQTIKE